MARHDLAGREALRAVVDDRLRRLAALSQMETAASSPVDMSAAAVTARLLECAEISALALELVAAGAVARIGP